MTTTNRPLIIVGVDGSEQSTRAVAWGADYAKVTGGVLELFTSWYWPQPYGYPMAIPSYDGEAVARTVAEKAAAEVTLPPDQLRTTVVSGPPAQLLVEASARADLLVIGNRGHSGLAGLLLGSVGAHCVHHAHCPVVVVRPTDTDHTTTS
jgi:nucleotide-binding universal stress UspA family protein